jgi:hypothetical protein
VPLFDALVEFALPPETDELSCRISSSNVPLALADEPLVEPVAAVLVGVVPVLSLIEKFNAYSVSTLLTVDVPKVSAPVAAVVPELAPLAEVLIPEPAVVGATAGEETVGSETGAGATGGDETVGGETVGGPGGGPPWLPSTPCPAICCWKSLKSVCTSFNKVWKSVPSDELLELDDEPLVGDEPVPLFNGLAEIAPPSEGAELSSRISIWNDPLPLADEPLLEPVAAVLVGVVPGPLLIEKVN